MNTHKDTHANPDTAAAPRSKRRWTIAAALAVAVGAAVTSFASAGPSLHGHHGQGAMSRAAMQAHVDQMIAQCALDATSEQKARLSAIANAAMADLRPVHEQFRTEHARAHALLMAPVIDRAALEQWRAAQMQRMDVMSVRIAMAVEDGAEVLTPEQRARCGAKLGALMH